MSSAATPTAPGGTSPGSGAELTAGCSVHTGPPQPSIDGTPQPANQNALREVAQRVQETAAVRFADVYAGVALYQVGDRIRVYRKPSADFDAWIRRDFADECVEVYDARYSARELYAWQERINADDSSWRARGVHIVSSGADFVLGEIEVGVEAADVELARREFPLRYGAEAPIIIVEGKAITAA